MLFSVISAFDAAYAAYNDFQHGIERFWTLRWLEQNGVTEVDAAVMKDGLVRAETLPLVFRLAGTEAMPRGSRVRARVTGIDLLTLDLHTALAARIEAAAQPAEDEIDEEAEVSGPLTLAIDVDEATQPAGDATA